MYPDVSIILVNYNGLSLTCECIQSIAISARDICYEILVVDNGSSDGSRDVLASTPGIVFIDAGKNIGFGRANNLALERASGRNVIFLNNDTLLREGNPIKALSDFLDAHDEVGACGVNLVSLEGTPSVSFSKFRPSVMEEIMRFLEIKPEQFNYSAEPVSVDVISGADLMVKHSVLDEVGGFNPSFFMYYEDTELCYRIKEAGYKLFCLPRPEIVHIGGASTKPNPDDPYNIRRLTAKAHSRETYYSMTHGRVHSCFAEIIRHCTTYSRLMIHAFNPEKRAKWAAYRKNNI